jgi:hypothetical protein
VERWDNQRRNRLQASVEIRGNKKARVLWYADCGVTAVSNGIIVHTDVIKDDPEIVRSFGVDAVNQIIVAKWFWQVANNSETEGLGSNIFIRLSGNQNGGNAAAKRLEAAV